MQFSEIVTKLGNAATENDRFTVTQEYNPEITRVAAIEEATPGTLSYIEGGKFAAQVTQTAASALILPLDEALQAQATERHIDWIASSNPRLLLAQAIALFYQPFQPAPNIHPSAVIDPSVVMGENVSIGANVVIQAGAKIGDRVCIHANVAIYPDVEIGDLTVLHANCTIQERSQIGADCVIHSGAVIGGEGFGFVPTSDGWFKMEQSGYTVLEDGVEVGGNSAIDRPAVGETRIGRHTKIDNLVQIGHGCQVGQNCAIASQVGLAGGVKVGNQVLLAGKVGIANQATIGDGAIATAKAGIYSDIQPEVMVSGYPALPHRRFLQVSAIYKRLPQIYETLKQIQRQLKIKN